mgnify:CR=1 FL=1
MNKVVPSYYFEKNDNFKFSLSGYEYKEVYIFLCGQNGFWFILKNKNLGLLNEIYTGKALSSSAVKLKKKLLAMPISPPMKIFELKDYKINEIQIEEQNSNKLELLFEKQFSIRSFFSKSCSVGIMFFKSLENVLFVISLSKQYCFDNVFGEFDISFFKKNRVLSQQINQLTSIHIHNIDLEKDEKIIRNVRKQYFGELILHLSDYSLIEKYIDFCLKINSYLVFEYADNFDYLLEYENYVKNNQKKWKFNILKYSRIDIYKKQVSMNQYVSNCNMGYNEIYVDHKMNLYACRDCKLLKYSVIGNLSTDSLLELWQNSLLLKEMRLLNVQMFEKCSLCDFRYLCGGQCRLKAYKYYKSIVKPVPYCEDIKQIILDTIYIKYQCIS